MANGEIFKDIKAALDKDPGSLTIPMRDRLVLAGIIQLYEEINEVKKRQEPMYNFYKLGVLIGSAFVALLTGFLWGVFTGQIQVTFK